MNDTIAAPATAIGRAGIGIIRISGSQVTAIAKTLIGKVPAPRYAHFSQFISHDKQIIDEGLVLFFPAPHSFTGEDVLELHGHGGAIVMDVLLKHVLTLGARLARPGEFSERAFLNNKLDLAQAEAIADLIDAGSEQAARAAIQSLQGVFSQQIHAIVEQLIALRMFVEAAIDFPEEEIDFLSDGQVSLKLTNIIDAIDKMYRQAQQGVLLREGMTVVIAGAPNVGKSTLLNQLSGRDSAIVTEIPGTTRDVLREHIQLDGLPLQIIDTAGLRESADIVEQEGIRRARDEIAKADRVLYVIDGQTGLTDQHHELLHHPRLTVIFNKIDLTQDKPSITEVDQVTQIKLSAKIGVGLELLKEHLKNTMGFQANSETTFSARRRHIDALQRAREFIDHGRDQLQNLRAGELLAEDLRLAQLALNEITGEFTSDDLLGRIFQNFCIGK